MSVSSVSKLSDHACVLLRQRSAKAVLVLVVESDGSVSQGVYAEKTHPEDIERALCEAIVYNANSAREMA